jgi:hypothetical protein
MGWFFLLIAGDLTDILIRLPVAGRKIKKITNVFILS